MDFNKLIDFLKEASTPGDRTVTAEVGKEISVTVVSDIPFDPRPQQTAILSSKYFEQVLEDRAEKTLKGKKYKDSVKSKVIPGIGNFKEYLDMYLRDTVRANMGLNGALVNRTGQFLSSVKTTKVIADKKGMLSVFFTYMRYPYATFAKGGKQYSSKRDPDALIAKSIREVAKKASINRLKAVPE